TKAKELAEKLTTLELTLTNPAIKADEDDLNFEPKLDHDLTYLAGVVASADRRPTAGSVEMARVLEGRLDATVSRFEALLAGEVAACAQAADRSGLPRIAPAPKIDRE